ncbi:Major facilitator coppper-regulated transporter crmC [Penicillium angulare]|uniref:Major facilitator coppper-regulated transporter crmC n=1 Tax=Penicillium angulare TaxID=116970 RepID=UPI0025400BA9|nr:Major facilitator coppper-regulated transporter crmC [Penicillium angulare]KAJ5272913.1 Major facilitator coppper-regulated transporter crmC [Penicillium angulare]
MCQIFIALGGETLVIGDEMAVMAAADRDGVPLLIVMISLSSGIGRCVGYGVAILIYSNTFPQALLRSLPESAQADFTTNYTGESAVQTMYPVGSETQNAINYAWGYSQRYECITAACLLVLAFSAIALWKNYNVDRKQVKGTVI